MLSLRGETSPLLQQPWSATHVGPGQVLHPLDRATIYLPHHLTERQRRCSSAARPRFWAKAAGATGAGDWPDDHGLPPATGMQQVEPGRASAVRAHQHELARPPSGQPRGVRPVDRRHHHPQGSPGPCRVRRRQVPSRGSDLRPVAGGGSPPAPRSAPHLELHHPAQCGIARGAYVIGERLLTAYVHCELRVAEGYLLRQGPGRRLGSFNAHPAVGEASLPARRPTPACPSMAVRNLTKKAPIVDPRAIALASGCSPKRRVGALGAMNVRRGTF